MSTEIVVFHQDGELISPTGSIIAMRELALDNSALIGRVVNATANTHANDALVQINLLLKEVEGQRVSFKAPFLESCRKIDATAKTVVAPLLLERDRICIEIADFQRSELAKTREIDRLRADEAARIAATNPNPEHQLQELLTISPAYIPAKADGQSVREVPQFEVTDIYKLMRARPDLVRMEPNKQAINEVLALGITDIPGLRIWRDVKISTRAAKHTTVEV